jgi:competence protein ComEA
LDVVLRSFCSIFVASVHAFSIMLLCTLTSSSAKADLPDGPGKAATVRVCGRCHSPERAVSLHQSRSAWEDTITKMVKLGAQGSDEEFEAVLTYLSKHFDREQPGPVNINTAKAVDMEAGLLLLRSQAKAIVRYREENGDFKSIEDLKRVPGLDFQKVMAKHARITF